MAKNKIILDVKVDDKGGTKKLGVESKKTAKNLDKMGTSARTADRNIKGAAQASSGASKNFSKMAQGAGGLVGVYATLAATAFAVSAAFNFLKSAMDFKNLLEGQKALGAVTGVAYKTISNSLVEATDGQLKYAEAAKAAAIGTASGISPDQLTRLGAAAKNASIALGRDLGDSFDRLIRGVTKAEPELLDELGIILRLENATRKYGQEIGKSKDELNEFERSQAVANEVLEQAERKFGAMEKMMDPTAHSLNQFAKSFDDIINTIKVGISGPLAATASFLANNMLALSGAVALFAGGLLKQVLPSMSAWKESSQATAKQVQRDQQAVQLRLQRTKKSYEKLKLAQMDSHAAAKKSSAKIVEGTTGGTKSGQGALDYFKGDTDSKKSSAAAAKALKHAESQIGLSANKRTGLLRKMNDQQVKDLRASYDIRSAIHKKGMTDFKFHLKQGGFAIKTFKLQLSSMAATSKAAFATLASAAATAGRVIGKAFFWISMLSIAYDGLKMLYEFMFPADEATKKLETRTAALTEKYKLLGEELGRTTDVMKNYLLLNSSEMVQTRGKAVASLNVKTLIEDINQAHNDFTRIGKEIPEELKNSLLSVAFAAEDVDSGFKVLVTSLTRGKKITKTQKEEVIQLDGALQNIGLIFAKLPSKVAAMNRELNKLTDGIKKPFATDLQASLTDVTEDQDAALKELKAKRILQANELKEFRRENNLDPKTGKPLISYQYSGSQDAAGNVRTVNAAYSISEATKEDHKYLIKQLADEDALILSTSRSLKSNTLFSKELVRIQGTLRQLGSDQAEASKTASKMKTVGISIDQKLVNIAAKNFVLLESANDEKQKLLLLQAQEVALTDENAKGLRVARKDLTDANVILLEGVQAKIELAKTDLEIAEDAIVVGLQANTVAMIDLSIQQQTNNFIRERLELTQEIFATSLALKNIEAGGTGLFGQARGQAALLQKRKNLNAKATGARADVKSTSANLLAEQNKEGDLYDPEKVAAAQNAANMAQQRLASISQEIVLLGKRNELALLSAQAETEALQLKVQSISMNPALTAFNVRMNELKAIGTNLNEEEQVFLYEQIKAQTILAKMAENKQALFDGIASSMSNAFTSIVTGTASAKQAFASMAISILTQISQMIVQMMVMRMLMSAFGMTPVPTAGVSSIASQNASLPDARNLFDYRNGGVSSNGKKLQGYSTGGVARGSTSGYPATLHGTEAVVPLPNGRAIPVDMKDSGATNNNIVVNISTDGQSNTEGSTGPDMDKMGGAIARAVQEELHNQKRSGGILNPYGAA
jgi:hypothetical protein